MDTRTGEIVGADELGRMLKALPKDERRAERKHFVRLDAEEAARLGPLTPAERIALKVRGHHASPAPEPRDER